MSARRRAQMTSRATTQLNRATSLRCLALIALVFWTGGAGCLLCCAGSLLGDDCHQDDRHQYGPPTTSGATAETACGTHDRCGLRERGSESASVSEPTVAPACCLLAGRPNPAAFPPYHQAAVNAPQERVARTDLYGSAGPDVAFNDTAPRSRGSTYLVCCALLI